MEGLGNGTTSSGNRLSAGARRSLPRKTETPVPDHGEIPSLRRSSETLGEADRTREKDSLRAWSPGLTDEETEGDDFEAPERFCSPEL